MATSEHPFPHREPVENAERESYPSLQDYVMSQANELPYFWPNYNAEMTQDALQSEDIENGTYILRPSSNSDPSAKRFLTLSIKMVFPKEQTKVWHFPVIINSVEGGEDRPWQVNFSLTQAANSLSNQICSLEDLLKYHHHRPLKGGKLPDICKVVKGLPYNGGTGLRESHRRSSGSRKGVYEMNPVTLDQSEAMESLKIEPTTPSGESVPIATARHANTLQVSKSQRQHRPVSPQPPPRSRTLPLPNKRTPRPVPRPRRQPKNGRDSNSSSSTESIEEETNGPSTSPSTNSLDTTKCKTCQCGLPLEVTSLPKFWTVHRSNLPETMNMLYFRNPAGRTAWALPPHIDRECANRNYLRYGRLNANCFQQYSAEMNYSPSSELSSWSDYSTYSQRSA